MSGDYLWDRSGEADEDVARLESLLKPLAHDAPLDEMRLARGRRSRLPWFVAAGVFVAAAAAAALWFNRAGAHAACEGDAGFAFDSAGTGTRCEGRTLASGRLPPGGTLETGEERATLTIANIGTATLGAGSRVRLLRTDHERHQLALDHGTMHAKVVARPRLFAVTTPNAEVVDLGCEYDLTVDKETGRGHVSVADGVVELATTAGAIVTVPEGCRAAILGPQRPGLPTCLSTTPAVAQAAVEYDHGDPGAADRILASATDRDAVILLALAAVDTARRARIYERLAELSPPPDVEVTAETVVGGNAEHLRIWSTDILEIYVGVFGPDTGRFWPPSKQP